MSKIGATIVKVSMVAVVAVFATVGSKSKVSIEQMGTAYNNIEIMESVVMKGENENEWSWELSDTERDNIFGNRTEDSESGEEEVDIGSGIYNYKDRMSKLRAELLDVMQKSVDEVNKSTGINIEVPWVLGTVCRETANSIWSSLENSNIKSIHDDLILINPVCGKGDCSYIKGGVSHFVGGTVVNGVDRGDPRNQEIDTDMAHYDGDHAIGFMQLEVPYIYSKLTRIYGKEKKSGVRTEMDTKRGFIRPNPMYVPDIVYNSIYSLAVKPTNCGNYCKRNEPSDYEEILSSSRFAKMSEYNQDCIKFIYSSCAYGRGHIEKTDDEMVEQLIGLVNSGKVKNIDELANSSSSKFWSDKRLRWKSSMGNFADEVNDITEINIPRGRVSWYGLYAVCSGKIAYTSIQASLKNSSTSGGEFFNKEEGRYRDSGSDYYSERLGIRWYNQTSRVNPNSMNWGNIRINGTTSLVTPYKLEEERYGATMATGGCGVYTIAMIASNIYDKDITPDIVLATLEGKHMSGALTDVGVGVICNKLGLTMRTEEYNSNRFKDIVSDEIDRGNMILFVGKGGPNPWYGGKGHFMAIRGIDSKGKLIGISSTGNYRLGLSAYQTMAVHIDFDDWVESMSENRPYVWVIGR